MLENVGFGFRQSTIGDLMNEQLNENNFNRLAKMLMQKHQISYPHAMERLSSLKLHVICSSQNLGTEAFQAALLTAVNCGCRSFLGGVYVSSFEETALVVPWPDAQSLDAVVRELGGKAAETSDKFDATLVVGHHPCVNPDAIRILCDGWRGGVQPADIDDTAFVAGEDFAIGGVLGGALAVEYAFLRACGLSRHSLDGPTGLSLWLPDGDWLSQESMGPPLQSLPKRLWFIGLGHLGQAYAWSLGLLPYSSPKDVSLMLQDFDRVVKSNWTAGLLCWDQDPGEYKTRVVARWLETRGFQTTITERPYDEHTHRTGEEPFVALCGVDVTAARRLLEKGGFDLVVECGVGSSPDDFDRLKIHTFPNASKRAMEIWPIDGRAPVPHEPSPMVIEALKDQGDCGILATTIENKSISASFVGAAAGAMVIGEVLRALHEGLRCELLHAHLRSPWNSRVFLHPDRYKAEMARTGFVNAKQPETRTSTVGISERLTSTSTANIRQLLVTVY